MKKTKLLVILLAVAMVLCLAACNKECTTHADNDGDGLCDECQTNICTHTDSDNDMLCDICGKADCYNHLDADADGKCEFCGAQMPCNSEHYDIDGDRKCDSCGESIACGTDHVDADADGSCDYCDACIETHVDANFDGSCDTCSAAIECITIAEALELCGDEGNVTAERYYIRATVDEISNATYGAMTISDSTGSISVYGTYSVTGALTFPEIESVPSRGDEVILHCILQNYNGTKEVKNARLVGFKDVEVDLSAYTQMTVAEARAAELGTAIKLSGVVARITYATGMIPSGFILVDDTASIYVYGREAANVSIGNTVTVAGLKDYWILDTEQNNAAKFGYGGCNQISDIYLIENDNAVTEFPKTAIEETTIKAILDTPVTEDITTTVYKVTALVKKVPNAGFTNYYFYDLDEKTSTYAYTQCNGSDFAWLDEFDGKICTVYLTPLNAKSTASDCYFRFLPIAVIDENYTFDVSKTAQFVLDYHAVPQFNPTYMINAKVDLITAVSSTLLGFENATVTYSVSDNTILSLTEAEGAVTLKALAAGNATVTVTVTHNDTVATKDVAITVSEAVYYESLTAGEAAKAENGTEVYVGGIVGPSLVNQNGFYLITSDGVIAIRLSTADEFANISIGDEVVVFGTKKVIVNDGATWHGQTCIDSATVVANYYGENEYSTESFVASTVEDFYAMDIADEHSTTVFVITGKISFYGSGYSTGISLYSADGNTYISMYCSGAGQYEWLREYDGQTLTVEVAACNWNNKKDHYRGCIISVTLEDGTKVYNTLNFDSN